MTMQAVIPRLLLALILAATALWLALNRDRFDSAVIESAIRDRGMLAPVAHVIFFTLGTVLFIPGAIFGLAGGALFGPAWGTLLNLAGATLGATAAFLVARYIAADWVRARVGVRLEHLIAGVEAEGWRFVALVRLVPLFPFDLMNYALGITRISLTHYVLASLVCMLPGTVAYTWLGYAGQKALSGDKSAIQYGLLALALLSAIAFFPRLVRHWRGERSPSWIEAEELAAALAGNGRIAVIDVRGPDEFVGPLGHISGAKNLPLNELTHRIAELNADALEPGGTGRRE
jgi:uncharacterized membrane protein YdjX (TVP38/TMEM64 family)